MGTVAGPSISNIRIRRYQPEDYDQVVKIFRTGIVGLAPAGVREMLSNRLSVKLLAFAAPLGVLLMTSRRRLSAKALATLGAAAAVPLALFGFIRRALAEYVASSLSADLSKIELFYSATGAGYGSEFWVAELVEATSVGTSVADAERSDAVPHLAQLTPVQSSGNVSQDETKLQIVASAEPMRTALATLAASEDQDVTAPIGLASEDGINSQMVTSNDLHGNYAPLESAVDDVVAANASVAVVDPQVRDLVCGIVAAAVARFEGTANPSKSASAIDIPPATRITIPENMAVSTLGTQGSISRFDSEPVPSPSAAAPAPSTPAFSREFLSKFSYNSTTSPTLRSSAAALSRLGSESALPTAGGHSDAPQPRPTASERPAVQRNTTIVGHIALERKSWRVAELRRMSVAPEYRGLGIGRKLLETVVERARENQFRELVLHTSSIQLPARRLYEKAGWELVEKRPMQGIYACTYKLDLTKKR